MEVFEITGFQTGISRAGVNYLQPGDSFQNISNGYIYRQILQSRKGIGFFAPRLDNQTRVFGIFEHFLPDGSKELLVFDQNFLNKYNTATGVFDQIPFGGSMVAYGGFNISSKDGYVSGTSYSTATNTERFIFCGNSITPNAASSQIFFYDGTNVKDFTSVADNPNYTNPPSGTLTSSKYVVFFNGRLNFLAPTIAATAFNQTILFSGIQTSAGNGDKFDVAGSGEAVFDTYEDITGVKILGPILVVNFTRSNWTAEKTTDAFNPYFTRKIASVLGTNADFSAVNYDATIKSLGKTGVIGTDGRQSLRVDNKIPYFTQNEIDAKDFNLTYGGFDRDTNQFLWAYKIPESGSLTQNSVLVNNYEEDTWATYDYRVSVYGQTDLGIDLTWDQIDETIDPSWLQWDTTEQLWNEIGLGEATQKTLAGDDLGFVYELNSDFDDYYATISAITPGSTTILTVSESPFVAGDQVAISNVEGMTEINNYDTEESTITFEPYNIISATTTSIEIDVDSTTFSAYTANGSIQKLIAFSAETVPFNPYRSIGRRCYISHVEFLLDVTGGFLKVDVYENEDDSPYKQDILLYPDPDGSINRREWITMTVDNEANFHRFVLKQTSPGTQIRITSIRIHAKPGGLTSG